MPLAPVDVPLVPPDPPLVVLVPPELSPQAANARTAAPEMPISCRFIVSPRWLRTLRFPFRLYGSTPSAQYLASNDPLSASPANVTSNEPVTFCDGLIWPTVTDPTSALGLKKPLR